MKCQNAFLDMEKNRLRFVVVDHYIVFYIPDIQEQVVTILRVMYSGRNIEKQLIAHTEQ